MNTKHNHTRAPKDLLDFAAGLEVLSNIIYQLRCWNIFSMWGCVSYKKIDTMFKKMKRQFTQPYNVSRRQFTPWNFIINLDGPSV